jgi:acyl-CoA thioester hydrolase
MQANIHKLEYRVIYGDTDRAGVMYYGTYMRLFEAGRTEFIRSKWGMSYRQLEEEGIILPVAELYARYKAPARYDDLIIIETAIMDITKVTISFEYKVKQAGSHKTLAEGHTKHAATDNRGRLARIPVHIMDAAKRILET